MHLAESVVDINKAIVEQCLQGDRHAQHKLYKLYAKGMFNICLRMLVTREEAEDMLQECFAEAFQRLKTFRFESTFGAWLKQIVVNRCINEMKRKKADLEYYDDIESCDIPMEADDHPSEYELALSVENVKKAMHELPDGSRTIFSLYLLEGYDHVEIAQIMNITESTSKSQYMRARQRVKEILIQMNHERR
ncbi:MAG: RNA polymerase sigma factor [Bacteroidota bacterium]